MNVATQSNGMDERGQAANIAVRGRTPAEQANWRS